jgi:hypothetical protein
MSNEWASKIKTFALKKCLSLPDETLPDIVEPWNVNELTPRPLGNTKSKVHSAQRKVSPMNCFATKLHRLCCSVDKLTGRVVVANVRPKSH